MADNIANAASNCPISYALEIFGDRWTLLVLRDLMLRGLTRYRELLDSPEGIATNVLADRLKRLEQRGLISRTQDLNDARQFVYTPTETAIDLVPMLLEMMVWGVKQTGHELAGDILSRFHSDRDQCISEVQQSIRKRVRKLAQI
jgi:DNA-binding HxlR family transcriptional regulator